MRIIILDITARNAKQYNPSLCRSIALNRPNDEVILMSPDCGMSNEGFVYKKLLRIVPHSINSSTSGVKRLLRAVESIINYLLVIIYVLTHHVDVLHIQWLVFIDYCNLEKYILAIFKKIRPKMKLFMTVHNIYPHDLTDREMQIYRDRFNGISKYYDGFIVHLDSAKKELVASFLIGEDRVYVAYHGIYLGEQILRKGKQTNDGYTHIIMYGSQTRYKGADLLVDALYKLPQEYIDKMKVSIIGTTAQDLYDEYKDKLDAVNVTWINRFVSDNELYEAISQSDLILLPYRKITQSGVLLLALSYYKPILTSDLPSFRETLYGYPDSCFFESGNVNSLADKLKDFMDGKIDKDILNKVIKNLNIKYSWDETAKNTISAYGI